ncbi:MAG: carboxypeptidase regulatory-like domain-containing protein [Planctomycetaceae bacterium]
MIALLSGCGGGSDPTLPTLVPVTGVVLQQGQPLTGAIVTFEPLAGSLSSGATNEEGRFELQYSADLLGAVPGMHTVRISKMNGEAGDELIPRKFNEKSQIQREVTAEATNEFQFEI